jgi:hypothetical protein
LIWLFDNKLVFENDDELEEVFDDLTELVLVGHTDDDFELFVDNEFVAVAEEVFDCCSEVVGVNEYSKEKLYLGVDDDVLDDNALNVFGLEDPVFDCVGVFVFVIEAVIVLVDVPDKVPKFVG